MPSFKNFEKLPLPNRPNRYSPNGSKYFDLTKKLPGLVCVFLPGPVSLYKSSVTGRG